MPIMNGIQAILKIWELYDDLNKDHPERESLVLPRIVFLTAFKTPGFDAHLR